MGMIVVVVLTLGMGAVLILAIRGSMKKFKRWVHNGKDT